MNVCIFSATLDKKGGGPSRSVPILAKGLSDNGVNTFLVTFRTEDMNLHILDGTGVHLVILPQSATEKDIEKVFKDNQIDVIHSQGIWVPSYHKVCKIARRMGIPYIMTPRGALEPWCIKSINLWKRIKKQAAMHFYQRNDLQKAAAILATAPMEADNLRTLGLTAPIVVVPNGIVIDDYKCRGVDSLNECKRQMIFLSRIVPKKGIEILLDAWEIVSGKHRDWNLIIVGNGSNDYIEKLRGIIKEKGVQSSVSILPPAFGEDKYRLYIESSVFVLPTYSENFGMVIAEALSCGLPVITTKGAPWESLLRTKSGWWIDLSVDNLSKTLEEAMNTPMSVLFEMGQRGATMVRETYDFHSVADRMAAVYKWMLGEVEKPDYVI